MKLCFTVQTVLTTQVKNNTQTEMAAIYNMTSNTFTPFHITEHPFCSAQTLLPDGQGIIVGGKGLLEECSALVHIDL